MKDYNNLINFLNDDKIIKAFGKLDINVIISKNLGSLYYILPLIEAVVNRICFFYPDSYRFNYSKDSVVTVRQFIKNNKNLFSSFQSELLKKYFLENSCIRIVLFYYGKKVDDGSIKFDGYDELLDLLTSLFDTYLNCSYEDCNYDLIQKLE